MDFLMINLIVIVFSSLGNEDRLFTWFEKVLHHNQDLFQRQYESTMQMMMVQS
jgi:hypothetical protein